MATIKKAYKYRMYPNDEQKDMINQTIGSARFIYNKIPVGAVIKNVTVRKTRTNKYFVSIMFELEKEIKKVFSSSLKPLTLPLSSEKPSPWSTIHKRTF